MARILRPEEFTTKRNEILDAAQRLVFTKGYEQMSIHDILDAVRISNGAFHHYFNTRGALLEAIIERIKQESGKPLLVILLDPAQPAIEKLQGFFDTLDQLRLANRTDVVRLLRIWYTDDNALVRQKVDQAVLNQRIALIDQIVRQGVREGTFTSDYAEKAGEIVLSLLQGMGNSHARLLLSPELDRDTPGTIAGIVATHTAYMEAVERVLGAPINSLRRTDAEAVKVWVNALQDNDPA
jgi:AcrR family transcriptional regulator